LKDISGEIVRSSTVGNISGLGLFSFFFQGFEFFFSDSEQKLVSVRIVFLGQSRHRNIFSIFLNSLFSLGMSHLIDIHLSVLTILWGSG